jgi:hypothetical protein
MSTVRLHTLRLGAALLLASGLTVAASVATVAAPGVPDGRFRVSRGLVAPWVEASRPVPETQSLLGHEAGFGAERVTLPGFPACGNVVYDTSPRPPEGLFQGGLPAPAKDAAARLALTAAETPSVTLTCDLGVFDLHWATPDAMMMALDNVIWVFDRSPGALAPPDAPEAAVQRLLEAHFAGDMGFTPDTVARRRAHYSASLLAAIDAYFAHPHPQDEPPPINGDPITDSQEYPVLFSVGNARREGDTAIVPVRYDDGYRARRVQFVLRQEQDAWRIDDLRYEYDGTLREALSPAS